MFRLLACTPLNPNLRLKVILDTVNSSPNLFSVQAAMFLPTPLPFSAQTANLNDVSISILRVLSRIHDTRVRLPLPLMFLPITVSVPVVGQSHARNVAAKFPS
eukprot:12328073-Heterocapsa_arctica.AAC.1